MAAEWKSISVPLEFPPKVGGNGGVLPAIVLREPSVDALETMADAGFFALDYEDPKTVMTNLPAMRAAVCALSGQPPEVIRQLHMRDFLTVLERLIPLLVGAEVSSTTPTA